VFDQKLIKWATNMENNNTENTTPNITQSDNNAAQTQPETTPQTPSIAAQPNGNPPLQNDLPPVKNQKKGSKNIIIFIVIILIILVGACIGYSYIKMQQQKMQSAKEKTAMNPSSASNILTIGVDSTYPPMESTTSSGKYVGFDIDMGNMIAKDLGKKAVWKTVVFSDIFSDLNKGDYDIAISSVTITPQRKKLVDFSIPYLNAGEVLIVKKTNSPADKTIKTAANFYGEKIGVQAGTTDLTEALKLFPSKLVIQYPSNVPALADLQSGKIDAIMTDLPDAIGVIQSNQDFRVATNPLDKEDYGIVFHKNETPLRTQINGILTNMQNEGILQQLTNKWLD
jgi:polar amino acid transport system substrate-binding protein